MFRHLQLGFKGTGDPVGTATARFYVTDHLGTVRVEMDALGNVLTTNDYEPYGVALPPRVDTESRLKLTGQERDSFTNYDYMHFRFYASSIGRFLRSDPIFGKAGDPQSFNLYAYVGGNPVNRTDPLGLNWFLIDGKWEWHEGSTYTVGTGNNAKTYKSNYTHLLVVKLVYVDKKGVSHYSVALYNQNNKTPVATGTAFSGGAPKKGGGQYPAIPSGNYLIRATPDMHHNPPIERNPASADNNPMPDYGIQRVPMSSDPYLAEVWKAYGPMRARLNPMNPGMADSFYFHGQQPDANHAGSTSGCLSYGTNDMVISAIWKTNSNVPVSIDTPVVMP